MPLYGTMEARKQPIRLLHQKVPSTNLANWAQVCFYNKEYIDGLSDELIKAIEDDDIENTKHGNQFRKFTC